MARKTHTRTAVKTRWNSRHYDRLFLFVKKGEKEKIVEYAKSQGMSMNQLVNDAARSILGVSEEDWVAQDVEPIAESVQNPKREDFIEA